MKKVYLILGLLLRIAYAPIYYSGFVLYYLARLLLAIAYFLILEKTKAADIIKHYF